MLRFTPLRKVFLTQRPQTSVGSLSYAPPLVAVMVLGNLGPPLPGKSECSAKAFCMFDGARSGLLWEWSKCSYAPDGSAFRNTLAHRIGGSSSGALGADGTCSGDHVPFLHAR
eukprot:11641376-Alexandrium_andersonii.AAC.1